MKRLFVGNLGENASEDAVSDLFSEYGKVRGIQLVTNVMTRKCRGFGFVDMEGHEARAAMAALDGKMFDGRSLRVRFEDKDSRGGKRRGGRRR